MTAAAPAVDRVLQALAPALPEAPRERLRAYVLELTRFGAHTDLTGVRDPLELAAVALADALVLARHRSLLGAPVWEVGAGGASLLVPLALVDPTVEGVLVEPRQKRATFLRLCLGRFGLAPRLRVSQTRVEPEAPPRAVCQGAVSRAVYAPEQWLPLARALLRPAGAVVVLTTEAPSVPEGWTALAQERYALPGTGAPRVATWLTAAP